MFYPEYVVPGVNMRQIDDYCRPLHLILVGFQPS